MHSIQFLKKEISREPPSLGWGQETASKARAFGHGALVPVAADSSLAFASPLPSACPTPTPNPVVHGALLFLHSTQLLLQTVTPVSIFVVPTAAAASRPVAIEPTCMSINSS